MPPPSQAACYHVLSVRLSVRNPKIASEINSWRNQ